MANRFRTVNQLLGSQPRFGPFPADQLVPWFLICAVVYFVGHQLFNLDWIAYGAAHGMGVFHLVGADRQPFLALLE